MIAWYDNGSLLFKLSRRLSLKPELAAWGKLQWVFDSFALTSQLVDIEYRGNLTSSSQVAAIPSHSFQSEHGNRRVASVPINPENHQVWNRFLGLDAISLKAKQTWPRDKFFLWFQYASNVEEGFSSLCHFHSLHQFEISAIFFSFQTLCYLRCSCQRETSAASETLSALTYSTEDRLPSRKEKLIQENWKCKEAKETVFTEFTEDVHNRNLYRFLRVHYTALKWHE